MRPVKHTASNTAYMKHGEEVGPELAFSQQSCEMLK